MDNDADTISSSNYESDGDNSFEELMPQLLPVEGDPECLSRPPQTANEYLLQG